MNPKLLNAVIVIVVFKVMNVNVKIHIKECVKKLTGRRENDRKTMHALRSWKHMRAENHMGVFY